MTGTPPLSAVSTLPARRRQRPSKLRHSLAPKLVRFSKNPVMKRPDTVMSRIKTMPLLTAINDQSTKKNTVNIKSLRCKHRILPYLLRNHGDWPAE